VKSNELTPHVLRPEEGTLKTICGSIQRVKIVDASTSRLRLNIFVFETLINLVLQFDPAIVSTGSGQRGRSCTLIWLRQCGSMGLVN
jgi:hypothetical protein